MSSFSSVRHGATSAGEIVRPVIATNPDMSSGMAKLEEVLLDIGRTIKVQNLPREVPEVKVTVPTPEVFVSVPTPTVHIENKSDPPVVNVGPAPVTVLMSTTTLILAAAMPTIAILLHAYIYWRFH